MVMKKTTKLTLLFLQLTFFFNSTIFPAIASGTLVATPNGHIPIEKLRVGNKVVGYCHKCKSLLETPIKKIKRKIIEEIFVILTETEKIEVSKDHLFYNPSKKKFVRAKDIKCSDGLMSCNFNENNFSLKPIKCNCPKKIIKNAWAYDIELEEPKLFFVSESLILVHNDGGLIIGITLTWGLGSICLEGLSIGIPLLGGALLSYTFGKAYNKYHFRCNPAKILKNLLNKKNTATEKEKTKNNEVLNGSINGGPDDNDDEESTGRTKPRSLAEKLAMETAKNDPFPRKGGGRILDDIKMSDPRWLAEKGWVKVQRLFRNVNYKGEKIDIHYVWNKITKIAADFKFK